MAIIKTESGKWQADIWYKVNGATRRKRKTFATKNAAKAWEAASKAPSPELPDQYGPRTIQEAVNWYLGTNKITKLPEATQRKYAQRLGRFVAWCDLNRIHFVHEYTLELAELRTSYMRGQYKRKGLAERLRLENAVLKAEMRRSDTSLKWNPNEGVDRTVKLTFGLPDYMQMEHLEWLEARMKPRERAIAHILYNTAIRPKELHNLEWRRVLPDMLLLPITKTGAARGVPLNAEAREAFEYLRSQTGLGTYVLHGDRPAHDTYIQKVFSRMARRICRLENLESLPFHLYPYLMRKSNASHALIDGAKITDVAAMLGNTPVMVQRHYGALTIENAKRVSDRLESLRKNRHSIDTQKQLTP